MILSYVLFRREKQQRRRPVFMRDEYDIAKLNPRPNPYAKRLKKQITINIDNDTVDYFKEQSSANGIPYQVLINLYLRDCAENKKQLKMTWE